MSLNELDFLHTEAQVIHTGTSTVVDPHFLFIDALDRGSCLKRCTDIQESNILLGMNKETAEQDLEKFEDDELTSPGARKSTEIE